MKHARKVFILCFTALLLCMSMLFCSCEKLIIDFGSESESDTPSQTAPVIENTDNSGTAYDSSYSTLPGAPWEVIPPATGDVQIPTDSSLTSSTTPNIPYPPIQTGVQTTGGQVNTNDSSTPNTAPPSGAEQTTPNAPTASNSDTSDNSSSSDVPPKPDEPIQTAPPSPIYPTVSIKEETLYLFVGDTYQLNYNVDMSGATASGVNWNSRTKATTVSKNGLVTATKQGYDIISANGGNDTVEIRIVPKNMPTISVNTGNTAITSKDIYVSCTVSMNTEDEEFCFSDKTAGIRIRGNSTARFSKKPYRIKFDKKTNLLGMNEGAECKSWVLLAEWLDDSLIKNSACLTTAPFLIDEYSSDWRYVWLTIDGKDMGVYVLAEQNQINSNRIDIEEAGTDSTALKSGYLYEIDASFTDNDNYTGHGDSFILDYSEYVENQSILDIEGEPYTYNCSHDVPYVQYIFMKNDGLSAEQYAFGQNFLLSVFKIIMSATYDNEFYVFDENYQLVKAPDGATAKDVISAVVDVESLARMYLYHELVCSNDDHWKSFYMWVDFSASGTGKLTFGCPWDHDGTVTQWSENTAIVNYKDTEGYYCAKKNLWYVGLMRHEWFVELVKEIWQESYETSFAFESGFSIIDKISANYADEFKAERTLWRRFSAQTQRASEIRQWFRLRIEWMNGVFGTP